MLVRHQGGATVVASNGARDSVQEAEMTRLGYYGLLPLMLAAIGLWLAPWLAPMSLAFDLHQLALAYAGVVAAYLAGIGAGGTLAGLNRAPSSFLGGMIAVLVVWVAVGQAGILRILPGTLWRYGFVMLVLFYLLARDLGAVSAGQLPRWYGDLRARLTAWASLLLLAIAFRLLMLGEF